MRADSPSPCGRGSGGGVAQRPNSTLALLHDGLRLLAHVLRKIIERGDGLPGIARALPAAERLVAGPGAGRGALRPVGIGDAGLDIVEEPPAFVGVAVEPGGQAE